MKRSIILLTGMFFSFVLVQGISVKDKNTRKNRIYLGENTIIRKQLKTASIFSNAIIYTEQQGYSGDYDNELFHPSNPFPSIKLVAPGETGKNETKEDHIFSKDKRLLIWLNYGNTSNYLDKLAWDSGKSVEDMLKQASYMPQEYARTAFNADTVLTYSIDMEGKKLNRKYKHHKAILMYSKPHKTYLLLHCFLTDKGLKKFDSKYLKDIEKMFRFKE